MADGDDEVVRPEAASERPRAGFLRYARDPIWQMVGVLLTLVVALTPVVYKLGAADKKPLTTSTFVGPAASVSAAPTAAQPAGDIAAEINGDCNAVGNGNVVTCDAEQPSMDNVEVHEAIMYWVWFDGAPEGLPQPPPSPPSQNYPCGDWSEWLRQTDGIYFQGPSKVIKLFAGDPDLVALTDVRVTILRRTPRSAADGTWIKCNWGGGTFESYNVYVDTLKSATTITANDVDGSGPERRMPPAAIALDGMQQVDAEVRVRSVPGHLYEGLVTATISRNGKTEKLTIGSSEQPLRWIATDDKELPDNEYYGWDAAKAKWVPTWQPF